MTTTSRISTSAGRVAAAAPVLALAFALLAGAACAGTRAPLRIVPPAGQGGVASGDVVLSGSFTTDGAEERVSLRQGTDYAELVVSAPDDVTIAAYPVGYSDVLDSVDSIELVEVVPLGVSGQDGIVAVVRGSYQGSSTVETQFLVLDAHSASARWAGLNCGPLQAASGTIGYVACEVYDASARPDYPWEWRLLRLAWERDRVTAAPQAFECTEHSYIGRYRDGHDEELATLERCDVGLFSPMPSVDPGDRDESWPRRQLARLWLQRGDREVLTEIESWIHFGDEWRDYELLEPARMGTLAVDLVMLHVTEQSVDGRAEHLMAMAWDAAAEGFRDRMAWTRPSERIEVVERDESGLHVRWLEASASRPMAGWLRYTVDGHVVMPPN